MDQVEEVKQKTDIVALVNEYVPLKKAGRNYRANCPFHAEKTPSFMVSPELQIYKCFGCGESGDAFSFLEKYEGMEFYEALKFLAERAGVKLKPIGDKQYTEREKLYQINELAGKFYQYILTKHPAGREALNYVFKKRGLKPDTLQAFGVGFAPDIPDLLGRFLTKKKGLGVLEIEKTGLIFAGRGRSFDRFRGRITFPLYDHRGNCIGMAGRILPAYERKDVGKYINSPETPVYHKGNVLYGLNVTRSEIKRKGYAVVVEGELDLISPWQVGVKNIVAIKGTALTPEQIKILSRLTNKIVLALDSDVAGDTAARRGIEIAQNQGMEVRVARTGKYKDPDDFARADPKGLVKAIETAENVWDFLIDVVFAKHNAGTGEGKAKISREIVPILSAIEDKIVQAHYISLVAKKLGVSTDVVARQMEGKSPTVSETKTEAPPTPEKEGKSRRELLEERFLALAFQEKPEILKEKGTLTLFATPWAKKILNQYLEFAKRTKKFDLKRFTQGLPAELATGFSEALLMEEDENAKPERELSLLIRELKGLSLKEKLADVEQLIKTYEREGKEEEVEKTERKFTELTKRLAHLDE